MSQPAFFSDAFAANVDTSVSETLWPWNKGNTYKQKACPKGAGFLRNGDAYCIR